MATQMSNFGLIFQQVTGTAPGHSSKTAQLYASSSTDESGVTQLFMKDDAGNETPIGGSFKIEDGDGTELAISGGAQIKFVEGGAIDINWTDTDNGIDGDEFDLTFTLDIQNLQEVSTIDDNDLIIIDDGANGTLRSMKRSNFIESAPLDAIDIDGGAIDGTPIGANSAAAGTFAALVATSAVVNGNSALSGTLHVTGNSQLQGTLEQKGAASFEAAITAQNNLTVSGQTDLNGDVNLGDAASDTVTVTGQFDSNLVPSSDNARDLGSSAKQWKDLYINGAAHIDALGQNLDAGDFNISNLNALTASAIQVAQLDVVTLNSVTQSDKTLEVEDKLIVSALSASSANASGGGLRIGGGSTVVGHADVLWNHASGALDFSIGDESQMLVQNGAVVPSRDNDVDLGASAAQFRDLYVNRIAYIDQLGTDADPSAAFISSGEIDGTIIGGESAAAGTFTDLVANGNVDLGDATSDTITATGRFDSDLVPSTDSARKLGSSALQWSELHVDVGHVDSLGSALDANDQAITNINVDGGAIDGTVIGGESAAAGTFTNLVANGNVDLGDATSDTITATGRFDSDLVPSSDDARDLGSSALKWKDLYIDGVAHVDDIHAADCDIDGGAIDGTVIGANSAAAGTFAALVATSAVVNGNSALSGTLHVTGNSQLQGTLEQKGAASFEAAITAQSDLSVAGKLSGSNGLAVSGDVVFNDSLTIGSGAEVDTKLVFDGNAQDFYVGLDDTDNKLKIGLGSAVGTTPNMILESDTRNVSFQGDIQIAGNQIADSGFTGANPVISFDGNQRTTFLGSVLAGGGYGSGGYTLTTGGAFSGAGNMSVGVQGTGASFTAFGPDAGNSMQWNGASGSLLFKYGSDSSGNEIMNVGALGASDFAIDVRDGANNVNKIRAAAFVTYSDESLKQDVQTMNTALDTVMSLEGVEFTWKNSGERDFGFIAQDVQKVIPKAVHTAKDGVQGVDYSRLTSILVEAVKSQQVQIEELKNTISKLKK